MDISGNLTIAGSLGTWNGIALNILSDTNFVHTGNCYVNINSTNGYAVAFSLQSGGDTKATFGYDGSVTYLVAYASGSYSTLELRGSKIKIPNAFEITANLAIKNSANGYPCISFQNNSGDDVLQLGFASDFRGIPVRQGNMDLYSDYGNVALGAGGGYIYTVGHVCPHTPETGACGDPPSLYSGRYYSWSAAKTVYGHASGYFDAYDDLELVKQWGEANPKISENYDAAKLAPPVNNPFSILKGDYCDPEAPDDGWYDLFKVASFGLGCAKALAKKQDEHDKTLLEMLGKVEAQQKEIADLRSQLAKLTSMGGGNA